MATTSTPFAFHTSWPWMLWVTVVCAMTVAPARGEDYSAPVIESCPQPCADACDALWLDLPPAQNFSVFFGLEGSKQPQDFGVNAHFGGGAAVNWGVPLCEAAGVGFQIGTAVNGTANAVQVNERVEGNSGRIQHFTTVGIFQRSESGWLWGVAEDVLYQDYYDNFVLGQTRGKVGYRGSAGNEIGVQGAVANFGSDGQFSTIPLRLEPITQGSVYYRHLFESGAQVGCWLGMCDGHSEANVALGDLPRRSADFLFGSDVYVPLSDTLALFGEANFIMPTDTGTVDAYLGFEWRPWGGAYCASRSRFAPLFPVANNTSFAVDLERE